MAGIFYSRYVPPTKSSPPAVTLNNQRTSTRGKRKRDEINAITQGQEGNQSSHDSLVSGNSSPVAQGPVKQKPRNSRSASDKYLQKPTDAAGSLSSHETIARNPPSLSKNLFQRSKVKGEEKILAPRQNLEASEESRREPLSKPSEEAGIPQRHESHHHHPRKLSPPVKDSKKEKKYKTQPDPDQGTKELNTKLSAHKKISSRYNRSKEVQATIKAQVGENDSDTQESSLPKTGVHGLEPIPQPSLPESTPAHPSFSSLPSWLANATEVSHEETCPFEKLGIGSKLLANLLDQGLTEALPVQKALIPSLLNGKRHYVGDLCVSAPTGSGKTLAYALPMINSLRNRVTTRLRGLIVVPTRELVTQVFKVCEMCALGSNIQIATATGSKPMKEEQALLVEKTLKFDPDAYRRTYAKPLTPSDWDTFDLEELVDELDEAEDREPGYIPDYKSKVDILICTPGRLVDHVRSTKGFTLSHLEYFVIDEADKLLDDSFQEWVEVILPTLENSFRTSLADEVLADLGMSGLPRFLQKVILSATMTEDVSQLNSLHLHNPRLIIIHGTKVNLATKTFDSKGETQDQRGAFHLPGTLSESAIPVGDGTKKPLFLLQVLKRYIQSSTVDPQLDETHPSDSSSENTEDISSTDSESSENASDASDSTSGSLRSNSLSSLKPSRLPMQAKQMIPTSALVFTRSSEAAVRLHRLLVLLEPHYDQSIATITRSTNSTSSRNAISSFQQGRISILIATDRASRGLDLPRLGNVISYDMPSSVKAYVHRVGRTARAGKVGRAWTLVAHREGRWFWQEIGKTDQIKRSNNVKKEILKLPAGTSQEEWYGKALSQLKEDVEGQ